MRISVVRRAGMAALLAVFGLVSTATRASATAILLHQYDLNGSYADNLGGPNLVPNGGTLGASGYAFGANQGLSLSNGINPTDYSIVLDFNIATTSGFRKLVDLKNRASDNGLYNLSTALDYFPFASGPAGAIVANIPVEVAFTRDGGSKAVSGYAGGALQFSFVDGVDDATFTGPNAIINFFMDDFFTNQTEASAGFVDEIRIYNGALTADQARNPDSSGPAPVPEPATLLLLGTGLVGFGVRRRRNR